jgi:hypothetical protein
MGKVLWDTAAANMELGGTKKCRHILMQVTEQIPDSVAMPSRKNLSEWADFIVRTACTVQFPVQSSIARGTVKWVISGTTAIPDDI